MIPIFRQPGMPSGLTVGGGGVPAPHIPPAGGGPAGVAGGGGAGVAGGGGAAAFALQSGADGSGAGPDGPGCAGGGGAAFGPQRGAAGGGGGDASGSAGGAFSGGAALGRRLIALRPARPPHRSLSARPAHDVPPDLTLAIALTGQIRPREVRS